MPSDGTANRPRSCRAHLSLELGVGSWCPTLWPQTFEWGQPFQRSLPTRCKFGATSRNFFPLPLAAASLPGEVRFLPLKKREILIQSSKLVTKQIQCSEVGTSESQLVGSISLHFQTPEKAALPPLTEPQALRRIFWIMDTEPSSRRLGIEASVPSDELS